MEEGSFVVHAGFWYVTLDGTFPISDDVDEQDHPYLLPGGWKLAPNEKSLHCDVIAAHPWGTEALVLEDGVAIGTRAGGASAGQLVDSDCLQTSIEYEDLESYEPGGMLPIKKRILIRIDEAHAPHLLKDYPGFASLDTKDQQVFRQMDPELRSRATAEDIGAQDIVSLVKLGFTKYRHCAKMFQDEADLIEFCADKLGIPDVDAYDSDIGRLGALFLLGLGAKKALPLEIQRKSSAKQRATLHPKSYRISHHEYMELSLDSQDSKEQTYDIFGRFSELHADKSLSQEDIEALAWMMFRDGCINWLGAPLLAAGTLPFITCHGQAQNIAFAIFLIPRFVQMISEHAWLKFLQIRSVSILPVRGVRVVALNSIVEPMWDFRQSMLSSIAVMRLLSLLDHGDLVADYLFPAVARACDSQIDEEWLHSMDTAPMFDKIFFRTVARTLRFWELAVISLILFVVILQGMWGTWQTFVLWRDSKIHATMETSHFLAAAEFAGHFSLAKVFEKLTDLTTNALQDIQDELQDIIDQKTHTIEELTDETGIRMRRTATFGNNRNIGVGYGVRRRRAMILFDRLKDEQHEAEQGRLEVSRLRDRMIQAKSALVKTSLRRLIIKIFGENMLQMAMQASFFELFFEESSSKWFVIVSVLLSIASAVKQTRQIIKRIFGIHGPLLDVACVCLLICVTLGCSLTLAKLYFAFACKDHVWDITTACVDF